MTAYPHGAIEEVFPEVFLVRGTFPAGPGVWFDRNMTIVRQGTELTALNSVHLTPEGEAELAKLGKLTHVMRLGTSHGADDAYFVERFGATLWGAPGTPHKPGLAANDLSATSSPIPGEVFLFEAAKRPEAAMILDGGILVTCDSFQNWTTLATCSWLARRVMPLMGFGPAVIGKPWAKKNGPGVRADFDRLAQRSFEHLIPGHGTVLRDHALQGLRAAIPARYGA
jgi:hypothetical protein